MSMKQSDAHVELTVPAQDRMMMCVRLTTAGILSRAELPLDALDDVRMAVEEACNCLMQYASCGTLHLRYDLTGEAVNVQICAEECSADRQQSSDDELFTIRCILLSMVDDVQLSGKSEGIDTILLTKRLEMVKCG